jgi:2-hydroxy-6-oxonona-2,4-dienedioate hydrolase
MNEARYREAERRLWDSVGVLPTEQRVHLKRTGVTVRVLEVGEGPPVLFVHGAGVSGASWATLAGRLTGFRCILLDRPGTGLSDPLTTPLDPDSLPRIGDALVVDVLDALGLDSAHLVATSFGGYFALRAAAAHPGRIGRMVQFSWPVGAPIARVPTMMRMQAIPLLGRLVSALPPSERMNRMGLRQIGHAASLEDGRISQEILDWWLALLRDTDTTRHEMRMSRSLLSLRHGLDRRVILSDGFLGTVRTPTHFIWGEKDPFGGEETARRLVDRMPNADYEVFAGAGHAPWLDEVDRAAKSTTTFLQH